MKPSDLRNLTRLIWLYFWLLLFEGALRKWVVPSLAGPLLLVRAPVLLAIYGYAFSLNRFPWNRWVTSLMALSICSLIAGFCTVTQNPLVPIFGWQANFLHLPLMFVMAQVMSVEDVRKMGKWILLLAVPMAVLMVLQFKSGGTAWLNRGAGEDAMQLGGLDKGRIRPAGTFSFNVGVTAFFALVTAFVLYRLVSKRFYPFWLAGAAGLAILAGASCSGSRLFLASVAVVALSLVVVMFVRPQMSGGIAKVMACGAVAVIVLGTLDFVKEGVGVMQARVERASKNEGGFGGFVERITKNLTEPIPWFLDQPLLGQGLGVGTNAGAVMLKGKRTFLLAEGEWSRVILESGPILGPLFIFWRVGLLCWMGVLCIRMAAQGHILPLLLFAASGYFLLQGQFGQPTISGFAVFGGGLCLASMRLSPLMEDTSSDEDEDDDEGEDGEEEDNSSTEEDAEEVLTGSRFGSRSRMEW